MKINILHNTSYRFVAIPKPPKETSKTWWNVTNNLRGRERKKDCETLVSRQSTVISTKELWSLALDMHMTGSANRQSQMLEGLLGPLLTGKLEATVRFWEKRNIVFSCVHFVEPCNRKFLCLTPFCGHF